LLKKATTSFTKLDLVPVAYDAGYDKTIGHDIRQHNHSAYTSNTIGFLIGVAGLFAQGLGP